MRSGWTVFGLTWLVTTANADAQTLHGRLLGAKSEVVPPGVLVELIDTTDRVVGRALSRSDGRFQLQAPVTGNYRVRALRIGFRPSMSGRVTLTHGEYHDLDLQLDYSAVVLKAIEVVEQRVCRVNPDAGSQTAAAWGEALKALALSEVTGAMRQYHVRIALYERQMSRGGQLLSEVISEREGPSVRPFKAAPADSLALHGYVSMEGTSSTYHGPDAEVLLSDAFASTHCLRLVARPATSPASRDWIGIAFEPLHDNRPDIKGVLWLDRHTNELREVEYRYVFLPQALEAANPGGKVVFQRLPTGGWIVNRWSIRMPVPRVMREIGQSGSEPRVSITSIHESGGEVLTVRSSDAVVWTGRTSGIRGDVAMETGASPAGVHLRLDNTSRRALTDSMGRFTFDVLRPGPYTVIVDAPHLTALGEPQLSVPVVVSDSGVTPLRVLIPSQASIITRVCGKETLTDSLALLRVIVTDSATRAPAGGATVSGTWHQSFVRQGSSFSATKTQRRGEEVFPGIFWLCASPKDRLIELAIKRGAHTTKTAARIPFDAVFADHKVAISVP